MSASSKPSPERRHNGGRRRRDHTLEEVIAHQAARIDDLEASGSAGFRHYRRRASFGFALLAIATTVALYFAGDSQRDMRAAAHRQRTELARAAALVAIDGCASTERIAAGIRTFVATQVPQLSRRASAAFPERDCAREVAPLLDAIGH